MSSIIEQLYVIVGKVTLDHVRQWNANGDRWVASIDKVANQEILSDPNVKKLRIKGARAHKSHKDPTDPQDVISIQVLDEYDQYIRSRHVHEDGTSK